MNRANPTPSLRGPCAAMGWGWLGSWLSSPPVSWSSDAACSPRCESRPARNHHAGRPVAGKASRRIAHIRSSFQQKNCNRTLAIHYMKLRKVQSISMPGSRPKAGALRQGADVLLRQACVEERRDNVVLAGGLLSGAEVSLVIDIYAVSDRGEGA